jgi:hypothetical protein
VRHKGASNSKTGATAKQEQQLNRINSKKQEQQQNRSNSKTKARATAKTLARATTTVRQ